MKKILFLFFATIIVNRVCAYDFKSGELCYNIISNNTVEVTEGNYSNLSITIIPKTVIFNNITYSVTSIGIAAFSDCSGLTSVTILNSVTSIESGAFYDCNELSSVSIGSSVTSIGEDAFFGCNNLKFNTYDNAHYLGNVENPYVVLFEAKNKNITSCVINNNCRVINDMAFYDCQLAQISIPNSVISIGRYAFGYCKLTSVTIPNSVTSIGEFAFSDCKKLKSVSIPNSITSIVGGVFLNCSDLASVTIPNSVKNIGSNAFCSCSSLKSITIPSSVTNIGDGAFDGCFSLKNVYFQAGAKPAGWNVEWEHKDKPIASNEDKPTTSNNDKPATSNQKGTSPSFIKEMEIFGLPERYYSFSAVCSSGQTLYYKYTYNPNTVRLCLPMWYPDYVGEYKTYGSCKRPTGNLIIPETVTFEGKTYIVTEISDGTFSNCEELTSVTIPNSINKIGSSVFRGCSNLTSVTIKSEAYIGNADIYLKKGKLWYCVLDKSTVSVVSDGIQNYAGDIVIPAKITAGNTFSVIGIEALAFAECIELKSIAIPNTIKTIGRDAFRSCIHLMAIYCQMKSQPYEWDIDWNPNKYKVVWGAIDKFK